MNASAVQRKPSDKAVKAAATLAPEPQRQQVSETGHTAGVPLFLLAGHQAGASPPPHATAPPIQRQVGQERKDEDELEQGVHGNVDIQRQPCEAETDLVQAKLSVSAPDDGYEREADRIASRVIRIPSSQPSQSFDQERQTAVAPDVVQSKVTTPRYIQRSCDKCEAEEQQAASERSAISTVQKKPSGEFSLAASHTVAKAVDSPAGGAPLPSHVQSRVEPLLGRDLSHVRVHTDPRSQMAARSINARAFTHQNHIYLGRGERDNDVQLMAHEAAHVVQQSAVPALRRSAIQAKGNEDMSAAVGEGIYPEGAVANGDKHAMASAEREQAEPAATVTKPEPSQSAAQQTSAQAEQVTSAEIVSAAPPATAADALPEGAETTHEEAATPAAAEGGPAPFGEGAQGAAAGLETEGAEPVAAADQPGGAHAANGNSAESVARIGGAPDSVLKPHVLAQAGLIKNDCLVTELTITTLAEARRQQVSEQFLDVRSSMVQFVENNIATVQESIATRQAEVLAATTGAFATAHALVLNAIQGMEAHSSRIAEAISGAVESASTSVQASVGGVADQITDVINTIPLPDLPGVEQARRFAANLVNSAAGSVRTALGRVVGLIRRTMATGMNLLNSLLRTFKGMIDRAYTRISSAIMQAMQMIFRTMNRLLGLIVATLRRVLNNIIIPIFERVENGLLRTITELEQQSLEEARLSRDQHLEALAAAIAPAEGGREEGGTAAETTMSVEEWVVAVQQIGQSALDNNRAIIAYFEEETSGFLVQLITTLRSTFNQLIQAISSQVTQTILSLVATVMQFLQRIAQMVESIVTYLDRVMQQAITAINRVLDFVMSLIQHPVDTLITSAQSVLTRIRNTVRDFIGRLLGGENPSWAPSPIPIPIPVPEPTPVPLPTPVPTPIPTPSPGPSPGLLIIVVLVIIILLVLLYLLYRWLTRPGLPKPPKPPKKPSGKEYDPETQFNVDYSVPLVKANIQASAGEKLIFGVEATDKDRVRPIGTAAWTDIDPGTGPYEIEYQVSGNADWLTPGSGTKRHVDPTLNSRNIFLFIESGWTSGTITVDATVKDKALPATSPDIGTTQDTDHKITWTIIGRTCPCPTGLSRVDGPGAIWVSAPALYTYVAMPEINPPGRPNYENQTVLESFANTRANGFTMADLTTSWKTAHPTLNTPDKVANYLYGVSNNGTFVFDNLDQMSDQHGGFGTTSPFEPAALSRPTGVGYQKDQTYSCAGTGIGSALINRRYTTSRGIEVRKTGP